MACVLKESHSFTCTPRIHLLMVWTIPAFALPAKAGTHLLTPEGWKAELALGGWLVTYRIKWPAPGVEPGHGRPSVLTGPDSSLLVALKRAGLLVMRWRCRLKRELMQTLVVTTTGNHSHVGSTWWSSPSPYQCVLATALPRWSAGQLFNLSVILCFGWS